MDADVAVTGAGQADAPARALVEAGFVHPTFAEGIQGLLMRLERNSLA